MITFNLLFKSWFSVTVAFVRRPRSRGIDKLYVLDNSMSTIITSGLL